MFSAKSILCSATALYCLNVAVLNTNTAAFVQSELNAAPAPGELLPTRQPKPVNKGAIFFAGFLCVVAWWLGMCGAAALWCLPTGEHHCNMSWLLGGFQSVNCVAVCVLGFFTQN